MRSLVLTDRDVFPPRNGETIPIAGHVQALADLGPVDLACIGFTPSYSHSLPAGVRWFHVASPPAKGTTAKLWSSLRGQVPGCVPANPLELCTQLAGRQYDLTYVGQLRLMTWARAAKTCLPNASMMLNLSDSPLEVHRRLLQLACTSGFDWGFRLNCLARSLRLPAARRWERQAAELFDFVLVQSEADRTTVTASAVGNHKTKIVAAPNGVAASAFNYIYRGQNQQRLLHLGPVAGERLHLVKWFVKKVFRPLRDSCPQATLHLVGSISEANRLLLSKCPGVQCHGFVEDIQSMLESSTLSVAPMMMSFGVINKVAESMAAGLPATGLGAFAGFPGFQSGRHGVEVHSAPQWISAIQRLFDNPSELDALSRQGREFARAMCWQRTQEQIKCLLEATNAKMHATDRSFSAA